MLLKDSLAGFNMVIPPGPFSTHGLGHLMDKTGGISSKAGVKFLVLP